MIPIPRVTRQSGQSEFHMEQAMSFEEFAERFGITGGGAANSVTNYGPLIRNMGNIPTNRLPSHNNRQRRESNSSASGSDADASQKSKAKKNEMTEHAVKMLTGMNELRKEGLFCDVTLQVGNEAFPVHKNVLCSASPYFKAMFSGNLREATQEIVMLNGIEASMLRILIEYAYTGAVDVTTSNVQNLLAAANLLQVIPVRDSCCQFLRRHLDESNCVGIHCFAEAHACTELQDWSKQYMLSHFTQVAQNDEILSLSIAKLIELLSSEEINVDQEEVVFTAALRWLASNVETRRTEFYKVLEHVRLPLISPYFLHDSVKVNPVLLQERQCRRLIEQAEWYHLMPDRRHEMHSLRTKARRSTGMQEVIIAVGGEDDKVVLRSVEFYDPVTTQWKTLSCLPFAVSKHGLVTSGDNNMYLAGGEFPDGSASHSLWRYDPVLDLWWELAPMLIARSELGLAVLDGYVYAVGGWEGSCRLDSVERFNPENNSWELIAPMKIAVTSPAVVAHSGKLYVTGGAVLEDGDGIELVQRYDPKTNTWTDVNPMLIPRSGSAACILNGKIFVLGGWHASTENTNKVECYDIESNTWEFKASMCERRYRPGVAVVDQKIYILGGEEGWDRYHDTIECYNPETDTWSLVGEMQTSRSWLSCVTLQLKTRPVVNPDVESACEQLLSDLGAGVILGQHSRPIIPGPRV